MNRRCFCSIGTSLFILLSSHLTAQPPEKADPGPRKIGPGLKVYKGRRVAQTMHYTGAEWLTRDNREQEERARCMLSALEVKPGMNICDMGCGNGFYSLKLAKMTGEDGQVYATDIQPKMLEFLNDRADQAGIVNISPILGTVADPRLPKGKIDLILCVDVYHEFSHPEPMLARMRDALAPGGLVVLVEFRPKTPTCRSSPSTK